MGPLTPLGINLTFLISQIVNFILLLIILRLWAWKPILSMLEKRKQTIAQGLEDARVAAEARANAEKEAAGGGNMLSFIYQLARTFELEHGYPPNLLYLNSRHYTALMSALPEESNHDSLRLRLGMEIILTDEMVHPHVAWTRLAECAVC